MRRSKNTAAHIEAVCIGLKHLAQSENMKMLAYLLEMAAAQAAKEARHPGIRLVMIGKADTDNLINMS